MKGPCNGLLDGFFPKSIPRYNRGGFLGGGRGLVSFKAGGQNKARLAGRSVYTAGQAEQSKRETRKQATPHTSVG